ncbi:MAG: cupin domain-containing protein [Chloroflexi bacterium]|jgi:quercetin dioxygenase-like cupin family protein|nr:MAG: cupin [Chloroflexi bacterium OLB13]MBC6957708.1 cupin domain-containing protein [Chloroflexota bacterium]MBV6437833.1 hypothetical protein [Anaerolineae bacterium]MDL1917672.1 cupin domain-containing protein [Anaerolineae bacterium CFX4]OQY84492.1 MAG: hypothetical protein B6D42_05195 [Anaerolineae bacterium UTCFX5]
MADPEIVTQDDSPQVQMPIDGVHRRTMASGERVMVCEFFLERGAEIPVHSHMHEQAGYVIQGSITFTINGEARKLYRGDSYAIPGDVLHGAYADEDCILVEVFSPPREEYRITR